MSQTRVRTVLFVCSQNRQLSPTAEQVFSCREELAFDSAGTKHDFENPLTVERVSWVDMIFVIEKAHRGKLHRRFRAALTGKRVICLDIPDEYALMQPESARLLEEKFEQTPPAPAAAAQTVI